MGVLCAPCATSPAFLTCTARRRKCVQERCWRGDSALLVFLHSHLSELWLFSAQTACLRGVTVAKRPTLPLSPRPAHPPRLRSWGGQQAENDDCPNSFPNTAQRVDFRASLCYIESACGSRAREGHLASCRSLSFTCNLLRRILIALPHRDGTGPSF